MLRSRRHIEKESAGQASCSSRQSSTKWPAFIADHERGDMEIRCLVLRLVAGLIHDIPCHDLIERIHARAGFTDSVSV